MPVWIDSLKTLRHALTDRGLSFKPSALKNMSGYGMTIGDVFITPDPRSGGYWISYFRSA